MNPDDNPDPDEAIRHPVGRRCDPKFQIFGEKWATEGGAVVGYRSLNQQDLSGLEGKQVENDLSTALVQELQSVFSRQGQREAERMLIAEAVEVVETKLNEAWEQFAILHLEVCCRVLDSRAIFNSFVQLGKAEGKKQYKKAHVVLNDYVDNIKLMLSDGKYKDYTLVSPYGLTKLEPYKQYLPRPILVKTAETSFFKASQRITKPVSRHSKVQISDRFRLGRAVSASRQPLSIGRPPSLNLTRCCTTPE